MRRMIVLITMLIWISCLSGCSTMSGNVVPQKGPTMEDVYDDMPGVGQQAAKKNSWQVSFVEGRTFADKQSENRVSQEFHKMPNPELKLYVFPHLAGNGQMPVPGYYTAFSAYEHDYYALPTEVVRMG